MTLLGSGFSPRQPEPEPVVPDPQVLLIEALQASNNQLRESLLSAMTAIPAPPPVAPVDLTRVVQAVTDLGGSMHAPSADELAAAIARVIAPAPVGDDGVTSALGQMVEKLETLDFRMKGSLSHLGSGGGIMHFDPAQLNPDGTLKVSVTATLPAGTATETTQLNVERGITDFETRLDYDVRTDGNPVYVGKSLQGTTTATATWVIQKLTYDASSRLTRAEVLTGFGITGLGSAGN